MVSHSFASRELASFFAQLAADIGVSLDRPSFCVFRVWLRFLLFLFRVRVSVPVSRAACRVRQTFPPSSSAPSLHPNISVNPFHSPRPRNRAQRVCHSVTSPDACSVPGGESVNSARRSKPWTGSAWRAGRAHLRYLNSTTCRSF
jgi:hypothetical protein